MADAISIEAFHCQACGATWGPVPDSFCPNCKGGPLVMPTEEQQKKMIFRECQVCGDEWWADRDYYCPRTINTRRS